MTCAVRLGLQNKLLHCFHLLQRTLYNCEDYCTQKSLQQETLIGQVVVAVAVAVAVAISVGLTNARICWSHCGNFPPDFLNSLLALSSLR